MTLNKFCPVAQGEYYNIKSPDKSQLFFTYFFISFYMFCDIITSPAPKLHILSRKRKKQEQPKAAPARFHMGFYYNIMNYFRQA